MGERLPVREWRSGRRTECRDMLSGRARAIKNLADMRGRIDVQNSLANAVRVMHGGRRSGGRLMAGPVARVRVPRKPFGA